MFPHWPTCIHNLTGASSWQYLLCIHFKLKYRKWKDIKHISCEKNDKYRKTKGNLLRVGIVSEGITSKILKLWTSVMSITPSTCWQASPPSANTSMKTSWGHGKFVAKKRCLWTVLIAVRPVTIVAICSLFPPAKKIIESEITFLSPFKSEGRVCHWSLHHNCLVPCLYSL